MAGTPVSSTDLSKIIIFSLLFLPTIFFGVGVLPAIFLLFGIFMMKKSANFSHMESGYKNSRMFICLILILSLGSTVYFAYKAYIVKSSYHEKYDGFVYRIHKIDYSRLFPDADYEEQLFQKMEKRFTNYIDESLWKSNRRSLKIQLSNRAHSQVPTEKEFKLLFPDDYGNNIGHLKLAQELQAENIHLQSIEDQRQADEWHYSEYDYRFFISLAATAISTFYLFIIRFLFYKPLERNKDWITLNGIFSSKNKLEQKVNSLSNVNIIKGEKLTSYSVADELLKWAKLKEEGLISESEYNQARDKLLNDY